MPLHGSCLCKAVQYEIEAIDGGLWDCFCISCRKAHAADHNTAARVKRESFRIVSGAQRLAAFESSPGKLRHFCSGCGTHIYAERPELPFVVLRAATLDDDPGVRPAMRVWTSHREDWTHAPEDAPSYSEAPPA